jgi:hypothetical protein
MRRTALVISLVLLASQAAAFSHWNDVRASASWPGDEVVLRTENVSGPGIVNSILYAAGGVQSAPLLSVLDGPSTLEAVVPGPVAARRYYGFRLEQPSGVDLLAVRLVGGGSPARTDLTLLATDPAGDAAFSQIHLDLTECRVSRDATRLYASLRNSGGGFPVSSGLTFFSYLLGINEPGVVDPDVVFAMINTIEVAGISEPGLFQINGTGVSDLDKIGEITITELPGENTLVLSCLLADLEANPVFQSWYDPTDPRIEVAGFTQRITLLGGAQEADRTDGAVWHLREVALDPQTNQLPQLSNLFLPEPGSGGRATVVYSDADGNCPVLAELDIDGASYPLRPQTLDYAGPVVYQSEPGLPPLESGAWSEVTARFSDDNAAVVELSETLVGVGESRTALQMRAAPNPFTHRADITFELPRALDVELAVFDLAGRRVATLIAGSVSAGLHTRSWNGRDDGGRPQPAGVYFYRLRSAEWNAVRRLMLVR